MSKLTAFFNELIFAPKFKAVIAARHEAATSIRISVAQSEIVERAAIRNAAANKLLSDVLTTR